MILRNFQYWPQFLVFYKKVYQKKLLIHIRKDRGQLHVHAKVGRFSYAVTPRTGFFGKMTPLRRQKSHVYAEDLWA